MRVGCWAKLATVTASTARVRWNGCRPKKASPVKCKTSNKSAFSGRGLHMPNTVYISHVIDAPIEKVWRIMRDFNDMPSYHPGIKKSIIEGDGSSDQVGCVRRLTLAEGFVR